MTQSALEPVVSSTVFFELPYDIGADLMHAWTYERREPWRGESFEFAHFTDREIAGAVLRLLGDERAQTLQAATATVAKAAVRSGRAGQHVPQ
jgi:hypothetical protein